MRRILFLSVILSALCGVARGEIHRCVVGLQKGVSNRPDEVSIDLNSRIEIGSFDVTVAKNTDNLKVYRLPGTKLFVSATVYYEDHILGSEQHPDFVNMRIFVSPQKRDDFLTAVAYAETQVPFRAFGSDPYDSSTVTAVLRRQGRSFTMVSLSCIRR